MAASDTPDVPSVEHDGLKFKKGAYLTLKVERIMMHIARRRPVRWIANLHGVRESVVYYVARKTGFPPSALVGRDGKTAQKQPRRQDAEAVAAASGRVEELEKTR